MVNTSDSFNDKLERISRVVDSMKTGEFVNPTELFRKKAKGINPITGNGWFEIRDSLNEIPLKRIENDKRKTTGYIKISEEDVDVSVLILKKMSEIYKKIELMSKELEELKSAKK